MAFNNSDFDGRAIQAPLPDVAGLPLRREVRGDLHILAMERADRSLLHVS